MTNQDVKQVEATNELFNGVMQYFVLPTKKQRNEERFNKWVDEALSVFGFNEKEEK